MFKANIHITQNGKWRFWKTVEESSGIFGIKSPGRQVKSVDPAPWNAARYRELGSVRVGN
jgi:hypothetical protein